VPRFFRTPKGLLTIVLVLLTALGASGMRPVPGLAAAVLTGAAVDLTALRSRRGTWVLPSGAILTGLIVAMVLSPYEPWYVLACTSTLGVAAKYVFRTRSANIFNPAAFGIVLTAHMFDTGQSWWGALPTRSPLAIVILIVAGAFIADRVNKMPLVLTFTGVYFLLFTATAFAADPTHVAEIFRAPDVHAVLYCAFFILTDPPTSPVRYRGQMACGVIVAFVSYAVFEFAGEDYYLLAGVLVGNLWEAQQRLRGGARGRWRRPA